MFPVGMGLLCDQRMGVQEVSCWDLGKKEHWDVKIDSLFSIPIITKFLILYFPFRIQYCPEGNPNPTSNVGTGE
jgi:hypothetical protein